MEECLLEFLKNNNVYFKERANSVTLKCPRCQKFKLDIHKEQHNYICYKCAETDRIKGPNAEFILSEITNIPLADVKRSIKGIQTMAEIEESLKNALFGTSVVSKQVEEEKPLQWPDGYFSIATDVAKPGVQYLEGRGIPFDLALKLKIKYNPSHKQVVFPVYSNGKLVGYQGRSIDPNCPKERSKYTLPGFQKSHYVMFEDTIKSDAVIVAEGPISAIKFANCDIGYVATMGKYISEKQVELLKQKGIKRIYLALDRDAIAEIKNFVSKYVGVFRIYFVSVPEHRDDFGDCTFDECKESYQNAKPLNLTTVVELLLWQQLFR